jgi:hypothetical protein
MVILVSEDIAEVENGWEMKREWGEITRAREASVEMGDGGGERVKGTLQINQQPLSWMPGKAVA